MRRGRKFLRYRNGRHGGEIAMSLSCQWLIGSNGIAHCALRRLAPVTASGASSRRPSRPASGNRGQGDGEIAVDRRESA